MHTLPPLTDSQLAALQITLQHSHNSNHFPQYKNEQYELLAFITHLLNNQRN